MADATAAEEKPIPPYVLEDYRPLSHSLLWNKIGAYYEAHGHTAFADHTVPNFVTTNAYVARAYARVILGFIKDLLAAGQIDPEQAVYLIEFGAGSGRLGYRTFLEVRSLLSAAGLDLTVKLILTDLGEANRRFWRRHFRLKPWIKQGLIDVARYDVAAGGDLYLEAGGATLAPGSFQNPVILLANYLFDSLPCDLFWVDADGQLFQSLVELYSVDKEPDWTEHNVWTNFGMKVQRRRLEADPYADPLWNQIVRECAASVREGVVVFPVGAVRCLENLSQLCGNRFLLLSSDKGYHHSEFFPTREMHFSIDGCLSLDVNFRALQLWLQDRGGQSFFPPYDNTRLDTGALVQLGHTPLPATALAYEDAIASFSPYDFLRLVSLKPEQPLSIPEYLALLRLSNYDAVIAVRDVYHIIAKIPEAAAEQRHQLLLAIDKVWTGYFPLGESDDVPLALGMMMIALTYWEPAVELLLASVAIYGETAANTYHLALCCLQLGDVDRAAVMAAKAIKLDPAEPKYRELAAAIAERKQSAPS